MSRFNYETKKACKIGVSVDKGVGNRVGEWIAGSKVLTHAMLGRWGPAASHMFPPLLSISSQCFSTRPPSYPIFPGRNLCVPPFPPTFPQFSGLVLSLWECWWEAYLWMEWDISVYEIAMIDKDFISK